MRELINLRFPETITNVRNDAADDKRPETEQPRTVTSQGQHRCGMSQSKRHGAMLVADRKMNRVSESRAKQRRQFDRVAGVRRARPA